MQECMVCRYTIHNRTNRVMEVECAVKASGAFMLAGNSQVIFSIFYTAVHVFLPKLETTLMDIILVCDAWMLQRDVEIKIGSYLLNERIFSSRKSDKFPESVVFFFCFFFRLL